MPPSHTVARSASQSGREWRLPHRSDGTTIEETIRIPPMVGVPALLRWVWGPSARTFWPSLTCLSHSIIGGPTTKHTIRAVMAA